MTKFEGGGGGGFGSDASSLALGGGALGSLAEGGDAEISSGAWGDAVSNVDEVVGAGGPGFQLISMVVTGHLESIFV